MSKNYSAAELTRMQELGSAWIFRRALNDNINYRNSEDIVKDRKYSELVKLYPAINKQWIDNYYAQQKRVLQEFKGNQFTEFTRDGGFMDFITKLVAEKFKISKKDSWNPADIWCVKNEAKVIKDIQKIMGGNEGMGSIAELNAMMRTLYKQRVLVGISLKLISGKEAKYEEVNIDESLFPDVKNYNFNVSSMKCPLGLKEGTKFETQDSRVVVEALENGKKQFFDFQIKPNTTSELANLKFEPTASGASKARLGKTPLDKLAKLLKTYRVDFVNSYKNYPTSLTEFNAKTSIDYAKRAFNHIKTKGVDIGSVKSADEFIKNMQKVFTLEPHIATSKLMQLNFLYAVTSLPKEKMDNLFTDMSFLAQKKGREFGPFGKLY
jgi:hypothetical protein